MDTKGKVHADWKRLGHTLTFGSWVTSIVGKSADVDLTKGNRYGYRLLATIFGQKEKEYLALKTDRERAIWLANTEGVNLKPAGEEFIRTHLGS